MATTDKRANGRTRRRGTCEKKGREEGRATDEEECPRRQKLRGWEKGTPKGERRTGWAGAGERGAGGEEVGVLQRCVASTPTSKEQPNARGVAKARKRAESGRGDDRKEDVNVDEDGAVGRTTQKEQGTENSKGEVMGARKEEKTRLRVTDRRRSGARSEGGEKLWSKTEGGREHPVASSGATPRRVPWASTAQREPREERHKARDARVASKR